MAKIDHRRFNDLREYVRHRPDEALADVATKWGVTTAQLTTVLCAKSFASFLNADAARRRNEHKWRS